LKEDYPESKSRMSVLFSKISRPDLTDSLNKEFARFEQLSVHENEIMHLLVNFDDYQDPLKRLGAENIIESEILPRTDVLMGTIENIISTQQQILLEAQDQFNDSSSMLRIMILGLIILVIFLGFFLANYLT